MTTAQIILAIPAYISPLAYIVFLFATLHHKPLNAPDDAPRVRAKQTVLEWLFVIFGAPFPIVNIGCAIGYAIFFLSEPDLSHSPKPRKNKLKQFLNKKI